MLCRVRALGLQRLPLQGVGVKLLRLAGPDQSGWVSRMARVSGGKSRMTTGQMFHIVNYRGPPELFSMWACLCGTVDPKKVLGQERRLRSLCDAFHNTHGWRPHPVVLTSLEDL
jgi:hypothetical protein